MKKILLIGCHFEERPTGGVTMHVHRLLKCLFEPCIPNYILCDYKKEGLFSQLKKIKETDVMHIHASNPYLKLFYVVAGKIFGTKSIITVHGKYGIYKVWKNYVHKKALKWCDIPVLINKESYEDVLRFNSQALFVPAFIPPIEEEEVLPEKMIVEIKKMKQEGKTLFVTNASSRAYTDDGKEIYGIDFLVGFFERHRDKYLLIMDPCGDYGKSYKGKLTDNIKIYTGQNSFCGLVKLADVVIRNTPTDGDSFSVKEALWLHKPVIATNVVGRPEGTILFKYNDELSLTNAIKDSLSLKNGVMLKEDNALESYYKLYNDLCLITSKNY